jgi:hypothetical protein
VGGPNLTNQVRSVRHGTESVNTWDSDEFVNPYSLESSRRRAGVCALALCKRAEGESETPQSKTMLLVKECLVSAYNSEVTDCGVWCDEQHPGEAAAACGQAARERAT